MTLKEDVSSEETLATRKLFHVVVGKPKKETSAQSRESHARKFLHILFILCDYIGYQMRSERAEKTKLMRRNYINIAPLLFKKERRETLQ